MWIQYSLSLSLFARWQGKQAVAVSISHVLIDMKNWIALIPCLGDCCWP